MKRCPKCEFIYEDEQRLCEMDGTTLVQDSRAMFQTGFGSATPSRAGWKLFAQVAFPAIVLGVLSIFAFRPQMAPSRGTSGTSMAVNAAKSMPAPEASVQNGDSDLNGSSANGPAGVVEDKPIETKDNGATHATEGGYTVNPQAQSNRSATENTSRPANRSRPPSSRKNRGRKPHRVASAPRSDSKVSSFLRKTGKFMKKPFER